MKTAQGLACSLFVIVVVVAAFVFPWPSLRAVPAFYDELPLVRGTISPRQVTGPSLAESILAQGGILSESIED